MDTTTISNNFTYFHQILPLFYSPSTYAQTKLNVKSFTPFLSPDVMYLSRLIIGFVFPVSVQSFGVITNVINLVVFCKSGLGDGVSLSFLALSGADLGYLFFSLVTRTSFTLENVFFMRLYVNLSALGQVMIFYTAMFQDVAALVTLFIAIQKTLCVLLPFLFKGVFTKRRCSVVVGVIFTSGLAYYIPLFALQGLAPIFNPLTNVTRWGYSYSSDTLTLITVYKVVNRMFLPVLTQSILVTCLVVLTIKLKQSTRFRQSSTVDQRIKPGVTTSSSDEKISEEKILQDISEIPNSVTRKLKGVSHRPIETKLSGKELRAVRAVFTTTVIFVVCNFGDVVIKFSSIVYPEFEDFYTRAHYNTYVFVNLIQALLSNLGASTYIFIYLRYNTRFSEQFWKSLGHFITKNSNLS